MKSQRFAKVYLLSDFSGVAVTQLPTEGDEKVAFMATVGSTQRVISRSCNRYLVFRCATSSSVRTKCHNPFRKLGPLKPSSAVAGDEPVPTMIKAIKTESQPKEIFKLVKRVQNFISNLSPIVPLLVINLLGDAGRLNSPDHLKQLTLTKG